MMKRALTLILSAGLTFAALYATLGPRDHGHRQWGHHHHDCVEENVDGDI